MTGKKPGKRRRASAKGAPQSEKLGAVVPFPGAPTPPSDPPREWPAVDEKFAGIVRDIAAEHVTPGPVATIQIELRPGDLPAEAPAPRTLILVTKPLTSPEVSTAVDAFIKGFGTEAVTRENPKSDLLVLSISSSKPTAELSQFVGQMLQSSGIRALEASKKPPPRVFVSVGPMTAQFVVPVEVDVSRAADFIDVVSKELAKKEFADVQLWIQNRRAKGAGGLLGVHGVIIDGDKKVDDLLEMIETAGIPKPNITWETLNGYKLVYLFADDVAREVAEVIAKKISLAVPGGDPGSGDLTQAQHAPTVIKTRGGIPEPVSFPTVFLNPIAYNSDSFSLDSLPQNLREVWGSAGACTPEERVRIEGYLEGLGIPAPAGKGEHYLYARCPQCEQHDSTKVYVDRNDDGTITVRCLSPSCGTGRPTWNESALLALAGGAPSTAPRIDAINDVPATWAGEEYLRSALAEAWKDDKYAQEKIPAAIEIWKYAKAHADARRIAASTWTFTGTEEGPPDDAVVPPVSEALAVYRVRMSKYVGMSSARVFYDEAGEELRVLDDDAMSRPLRVRSESLNPSTHANIWRAYNCFSLVPSKNRGNDEEDDENEHGDKEEVDEEPNV